MVEHFALLCVDAKDYGNVARFTNHSCDPNCVVQASDHRSCHMSAHLYMSSCEPAAVPPITALRRASRALGSPPTYPCCPLLSQAVITPECNKVFYRLGIFASRDIPAMEELTYDYNYTAEAMERVMGGCRCGAPNCMHRSKQGQA